MAATLHYKGIPLKFSEHAMRLFSFLPLLALSLLVVCLSGQAAMAESIVVEEARVRAMPPGSPTSVTYMTLHNAGDSEVVLVDARSPAAASLELHRHDEVEGVMQMRPVAEVAIPAGGRIEMAPGGLHLMLIGLVSPLAEGDEVAITLVFEDGERLAFSAPVTRDLPLEESHDEGH
jgi:copper(I)-binding protein